MSSLPSGTVTFLFTDIERSTQTVEAMGNEAYADALDTHRELLRDAFRSHGGHEVATEGDAFFVAFKRAHDAVQAAVDGQRAMSGHPLRVRMGIHTGEALVRNDDYVGHDVHKAKRVSDAGHGGQILLSLATAELARASTTLIDLGPHRLKDLAEPERIFQVGAGEFPALRSLERFRTNLPVQRSTFVGRESEIAEVRKLLENNRLVTLSGVGGCGKTRLALQVGAELIDAFPDGAFFIELAPISDGDLIARTIAGAIGLPMGGIGEVRVAEIDGILLDHLARQHCLLLLDNCEHLLDACAEWVDRILGRCPDVRVLVTSREGLDVEGEQSYTVPSLSLPAHDADIQSSEAVTLFTSRARSALPRFDLTPGNVADVGEICRRLDGIPLAIELAASRVTHLSPRQISERLDDLFSELTGGRRRIQRQQTLQATLDWSYELLDEAERTLLARLAVFAGTFGLDAVEGICCDESISTRRAIALLASLVSKSLVLAEPQEDAARYRLLEPVRLYAAGKLRERGESETIRVRHRDWYLAWLEGVPPEDAGLEPAVVSTLERDLDNLRAAMEWSDRENRPDLVGRLASHSFGLIFLRGHYDEFDRWLRRAVQNPDRLDARLRAACYAGLAFTATMRVEESNEYMTKAMEIELPDEPGLTSAAFALRALTMGTVAWATRRDDHAAEARVAVQRSLNVPGLPAAWRAFARTNGSWVELMLGEYDRSCDLADAVLDEIGGRFATVRTMALGGLTAAAHLAGQDRRAFAAATELTQLAEGQNVLAFGLERLTVTHAAPALAAGGTPERAISLLRSVIEDADRYRPPLFVNATFISCAAVEAVRGRFDRATRLLGAARWAGDADRLRFQFRDASSAAFYRHYVGVVRKELGVEDALRGRDEGRSMTLDEGVAYALEGLES